VFCSKHHHLTLSNAAVLAVCLCILVIVNLPGTTRHGIAAPSSALRALRALRAVSFLEALRILTSALLKSLASIGHLLILLLLIMYVFAIMGFYFFGPADETDLDTAVWNILLLIRVIAASFPVYSLDFLALCRTDALNINTC